MTETVLNVLRQRRAEKSVPGARNDPFHVRLHLEGGGMKSPNTAAQMAVFEQSGYAATVFDSVEAVSGGALVVSHYMAGTVCVGATIFPRDLAHPRFLSLWRLGWGQAMSLRHLVWRRFADPRGEYYLNTHAVREHPVPLRFLASTPTGQAVWLHINGMADEAIYAACEATARVPLVTHPWWERPALLDGGLVSNLPWPTLEEYTLRGHEQVTHQLVLRSSPVQQWKKVTSKAEAKLVRPLAGVLNPQVGRTLSQREDGTALALADMRQRVETGDPTLLVLGAGDDTLTSSTREPAPMWRAMVATYRLTAAVLGEDVALPAVWREHMPAGL